MTNRTFVVTCQVQVDMVGQVDRSLLVRNSPIFHPDLSRHGAEAILGEHDHVAGVALIFVRRKVGEGHTGFFVVDAGLPVDLAEALVFKCIDGIGGLHSTEVAYLLLTHQFQVGFSAFLS